MLDSDFNEHIDRAEHYREIYNPEIDYDHYGYVAAYSHDLANALCGVGGGIYVQRFLCMPGEYDDAGIFHPYNYQDPLDQHSELSKIFAKYLKGCKSFGARQCWDREDAGRNPDYVVFGELFN
ncbi:hypothetical protein RLOatenuis_3210 [Rickettsiales bacterium]|nr:hypothetical protein RLOatenuis_3210 [Rickettsiales bacterium]